MAAASHTGLKLIGPEGGSVDLPPRGDDVTVSCHLYPETSAVAMEIRWFKETDCVYLYRNGQRCVREEYKDRVFVDLQGLQRGDVSLTLKHVRGGDRGEYVCGVVSGDQRLEKKVGLGKPSRGLVRPSTEERRKMEVSVLSLVSQAWRTEADAEKNKQQLEKDSQMEIERGASRLLQEKDRAIANRDKQLKERDAQIQEIMRKIEEAHKKTEEKERSCEEKDKLLILKESMLKEKSLLIDDGEKKLQEKTRLLKASNEQLMEMGERMKQLQERLEQVKRELKNKDEQLKEKDKEFQERLKERHADERKENRPTLAEFHDPRSRPTQQEQKPHRQNQGTGPEERTPEVERDRHPGTTPALLPGRRRHSRDDPPLIQERHGLTPPVSLAVSHLRLVLLGRNAASKKAAATAILGKPAAGETQHCESRHGQVAGRRVTLVETPDWFSWGSSERDTRQDVERCLRLSAPGPHGFLLVIPEEASEVDERRMLQEMEDIFGEGCWEHTLVLFTHAEKQRERSVEELLRMASQGLQQLVEKCGHRCHLLSVSDKPDDAQLTELLEKVEEMASVDRRRFYSSETYLEAERQVREIKRRMEKERDVDERKAMEERGKKYELDKEIQESFKKMEGEIQQHEEEIRKLNHRTTDLEKRMKEERGEKKKRELESEFKIEIKRISEMEMKLVRLMEKREMEEKHREEIEEMRASFEREARREAERHLMKIILPELQRNINVSRHKMEREFHRQIERKNRVIEEKDEAMRGLEETVQTLRRLVEESDERISTPN